MNYSPREIGQKRILIEGVLLACLMVSLVFLMLFSTLEAFELQIKYLDIKLVHLLSYHELLVGGGYHDNGGASFQSEPMMEFMKNTLSSGQSPYWNPYSSAGAVGPETLVDQKFSLFTICYAILGE